MFMWDLKNCPFYGVSALDCPLWRGFVTRDSLGIRQGQNFLSVLERCPLQRMSALGRFHCIIPFLEWKIGKFENVQIFTHYKILIMASKKERNHYDLKEIESYCITKTFAKRLARKKSSLYILANRQRRNGCQGQSWVGMIIVRRK